jgi:hypothetical protein
MAAGPEMWNAFIAHLEKMAARLRVELEPYKSGTQRVSRRAGDDWVDITVERTQQIEREIESLESTIARTRKDHA